ncbi:hypothetical protein DPMN_085308 [Dreissena polymorpha]|uniref:Uncharacterized protein n=1 Tax=Dreissena polymorpha TaxID=45954 RepID=A0A9D3YC59_DREPO|nr:hypothetical protein DPMN_085308 [Dreissena polymorpha]
MTATLVCSHEPLLATTKTRLDSMCRTVRQGTLEGGRRWGIQKKSRIDNVKEWRS